MRKSLGLWVLKNGRRSFRDQILLHYLEWNWWEHCEEYVRSGQPLRVHQNMSDQEWGIYQRGMRSGVGTPAEWIARQLPLSAGATEMLDIGGAHGYFSVTICRRHPALRSTILELPQSIRHAAPILAAENMGDRIVHRAGDALTDELGENTYDLIFLASIVHHFNEDQNRQLMNRIARALRPGGLVAIWEPLRQESTGRLRQFPPRPVLPPLQRSRHLVRCRHLWLVSPSLPQPPQTAS